MSIPIARVLNRLDEYLARKDYAAAERHLDYWMAEAEMTSDKRGMLSMANEQIGLYRKMNIKERSLKACDTAITLADEMRLDESITMGTTLINAATAYKAFGDAERALPLYEKAKEIYEARLESNDRRLGGLYNNMALALKDTEQFERAKDMFLMALSVIEKIGGGELEMAITYCNMADLCACEGKGGAAECLEKAFGLISTPTLSRDGYYAFVCEKCAPTFGYYGLGEYEKELSMRARDIYEGS